LIFASAAKMGDSYILLYKLSELPWRGFSGEN